MCGLQPVFQKTFLGVPPKEIVGVLAPGPFCWTLIVGGSLGWYIPYLPFLCIHQRGDKETSLWVGDVSCGRKSLTVEEMRFHLEI